MTLSLSVFIIIELLNQERHFFTNCHINREFLSIFNEMFIILFLEFPELVLKSLNFHTCGMILHCELEFLLQLLTVNNLSELVSLIFQQIANESIVDFTLYYSECVCSVIT